MRWIRLVWCLSLILPLYLTVAMPVQAGQQWGWNHATAGAAWAIVASGLWLTSSFAALQAAITRARRGLWTIPLGMAVAMGPALGRALLPWEEPDTGMGSPLATLISIVMLAVVGGLWLFVGFGILVASVDGAKLSSDSRAEGN